MSRRKRSPSLPACPFFKRDIAVCYAWQYSADRIRFYSPSICFKLYGYYTTLNESMNRDDTQTLVQFMRCSLNKKLPRIYPRQAEFMEKMWNYATHQTAYLDLFNELLPWVSIDRFSSAAWHIIIIYGMDMFNAILKERPEHDNVATWNTVLTNACGKDNRTLIDHAIARGAYYCSQCNNHKHMVLFRSYWRF